MSYPPNEKCSVDDCGKPAKRAGFCNGHYARKTKSKQPVSQPLRQWGDPKRTLMEAAFHYTDMKRARVGRPVEPKNLELQQAAEGFAEASERSERAYYRAWKRLEAAAKRISGTK